MCGLLPLCDHLHVVEVSGSRCQTTRLVGGNVNDRLLMSSTQQSTATRDVNFQEFYFSIREIQNSRLVEYSKLTRHSASMTHLMGECCNSVDITPRGCGWEVERRTEICGGVKLQSVPISLMYSSYRLTAVILDSLHAVAVIAQQ